MRLLLAVLLCIVGLSSATGDNLEYIFTTPSGCARIDGVDSPKEPNAALKLVGVRLVVLDKADKGRIYITFASMIKQDQKISETNTVAVPFSGQPQIVKDIIAKKYDVQLYVYVDTVGANSALDFGAPPRLFLRSSYAKVSATSNPYYGAPVKFQSIQVKLNGKTIVDYGNMKSDCGNTETSSNWLGQAGIYKLEDCDGNDCGGKTKKNYMWKRMYYDPVDGYVQW